MAGLLTARALSDLLDDIVVIERERLTDASRLEATCRRASTCICCSRPAWACSKAGSPGSSDDLERLGAGGSTAQRRVYQAGGYRAQGDWGRPVLSMTRPLLETAVRRRVEALDNVRLEDGVVVERVEVVDGRVTGAVVDGVLRASDLVVDCSGRSSRLAHQLESAGSLAPPVTKVTIDCAYTTGFLPRSAADWEGSFFVCGTSPPDVLSRWCGAPRRGRPVDGDAGGRARRGARHFRGGDPRVRAQPVVPGRGTAHRDPGPAVVGGVVPLSIQPAPALREGAPDCWQGSSLSATPRAASTRSMDKAWPAPPSRPRRSAKPSKRWACVRRAAAPIPSRGREHHRRSLGDRRRR